MKTFQRGGTGYSKNISSSRDAPIPSASKMHRYTVLYYKRKNKVHKSKGVSKLDGTLTFVATPVSSTTPDSVILTSTDTETVVYRGGMRGNGNATGIEGDDNRNHSGIFDIDQTISVGAYEVEILSREDDNTTTNSMNNSRASMLSNNQSQVCRNRKSLLRGDENTGSNRRFGKNLGIGSSNNHVRRTGLGAKRSLVCTVRKPAPQPSFASVKKNKISSVNFRNDENGNIASSSQGASSLSVSPVPLRQRANTALPGFKKPILRSKTTSVTFARTHGNNASSKRRRTTLPSTSTESGIVTTSTKASDNQSFFPGAIGMPLVPHSIRMALRPHQIEGVVFLWNCLTGNGQVKYLSPHIDCNNEQDCSDKTDFSDHSDAVKSNNISSTMTSSTNSPKGCILSDEMGLGKTLMTIATISALHRQNRTSRFVVVCPSSLVQNWEREFDKWLGKVGLPKRVVIKKGGGEGLRLLKAFSAVKPSNTSEVLIVSYDLFRLKAATLKNIQRVALLVVDEGHRLKNTSGSLTMTALESLPCEARLCITATPIQNNLGDMYTIVNFVCPGVLGDLATFRREYERPITAMSSKRNTCTADQIRRKKESRQRLDRIIQSLMLRRLQKDILKKILPPRHVFLLFCRPTLLQRQLYKEIAKSHVSRGGVKGSGSSQEALAALMGLRKICTHPHLLGHPQSDSNDGSVALCGEDCDGSGKLSVLRDIIIQVREKEPTDKIVIISNFTSTLTVVEDVILRQLKLNFVRLDGSISSADRQSLVDTFNRTSADKNFALTLSSKAGGVGLNLIGANRLVMVDPDWNPATDLQAMARIYREGQKKNCFIYRCFTTGTLEEVILQRQIQKGSLASLTMDGAQKSNMSRDGLNAEELRDCFNLKDERCACDTRQKIDNWPDYDGKACLVSQGCQDEVLLEVAAKEDARDSPLSFVHVVADDNTKVPQVLARSEIDKVGKVGCDRNNFKIHEDYEENGSTDDEYEFE